MWRSQKEINVTNSRLTSPTLLQAKSGQYNYKLLKYILYKKHKYTSGNIYQVIKNRLLFRMKNKLTVFSTIVIFSNGTRFAMIYVYKQNNFVLIISYIIGIGKFVGIIKYIYFLSLFQWCLVCLCILIKKFTNYRINLLFII